MKVYLEGTLKMFVPKSFNDKDGKSVSYNEAYFQVGDELDADIFKTNTQQDLSESIGKFGVATVQLNAVTSVFDANNKPQKGLYKPKLLEFVPKE